MSQDGPRAIDYFNRQHRLHWLKTRVALRSRRRMYQRTMQFVQADQVHRILDVGTTPDLAIPYNNFFEQWYPYPERITACSVEDCSNLPTVFPGMRFVPLKGPELPFQDREFNLAVSFAVLEHVGSRTNQTFFLAELARVSEAFLVYTPYRYFPVEMHTLLPLTHWLPARVYRKLWLWLGMVFWSDEANLNLVSVRDLRPLLPSYGRTTIRLIRTWGWPSNIEIHWSRT